MLYQRSAGDDVFHVEGDSLVCLNIPNTERRMWIPFGTDNEQDPSLGKLVSTLETIKRLYGNVCIQWKCFDSSVAFSSLLSLNKFVPSETSIMMYLTRQSYIQSYPDKSDMKMEVGNMEDFATVQETDSMDTAALVRTFTENITDQLEFWTGKVGDIAVTAAQLLKSPQTGYACFHLVVTDPVYQRKGYSTALLRHIIDRVWRTEQNVHYILVSSSEAGVRLYSKLGFILFDTYTSYLYKP